MPRGAKASKQSQAYPPRGMRSNRAAAYLDMSQAAFLRLVADGVMPKGVRIGGMVVWDRNDLDVAFDNLKHRRKSVNTVNAVLGIDDDTQGED
jgi:predicted DNA-binding transcriptional regulator AlpA